MQNAYFRILRDYKKYDVWTKAHELTLLIYKEIIPGFPKSEKFELASQIKRAAYSIPLNIVEGCGRSTDKDFARFLDMSLGSAHELEYCVLLGTELGYIDKPRYEFLNQKINEVKAKLINLIKAVRNDKT
jgi:four helix bundle protein